MSEEDNKEIKLHIGCGTVYLEGYVNIHPAPDGLAPLCPEDVEINRTTVDEYYKTGFSERPKKHIADLVSTLDALPNKLGYKAGYSGYQSGLVWNDGTPESVENPVDEICMFHVLEHIPKYDLDDAVRKIALMLKPGGRFRVAVPDFDAIVLEYAQKLQEGISEEDKEWYYRFVHGTQKDIYSHHYCGYNRHRLEELLRRFGFDKFEELPNQNFYPSVHLMAYKEEEKSTGIVFDKDVEVGTGNITLTTGAGNFAGGDPLSSNITFGSAPAPTVLTSESGKGIVIDENGNTIVEGDLHVTGKLIV